MTYNSVFKSDLFQGKNFLVTGGGSGIGRCIAHELSSLGANIVVCGRTEERLKKVCNELEGNTGKSHYFICDIREEEQIESLMKFIKKEFGELNGLVNNAGGQFPCLMEDMSKNGWEAVVKNNLTGTFLMSKFALNHFFKKSGGNIVNIVADFRNGMAGMAHTGAARAGVDNFTKSAAIEWAPYKVKINSIAPGIIESSGLDTYPDAVKELLQQVEPRIPLKKFGTESEISSAVTFLLSPAANHITGTLIKIDGGFSLCGQMVPLEEYAPSPSYNGFQGQ